MVIMRFLSALFSLALIFDFNRPVLAVGKSQPFVARSIILASSTASIWPGFGEKGPASSLHKNSKNSLFPKTSAPKQNSSSEDGRFLRQRVLPRFWARLLYWATAVRPAWAVLQQAYNIPFFPKGSPTNTRRSLLTVRLMNPRVTFAIGSLLRALQLSTALRYVFDPTIGVGAGLNIVCTYVAQSQWPGTIVLGWAISESFWHIFGARPPAHRLPQVPISLSVTRGGGADKEEETQQETEEQRGKSSIKNE